MRIPGLDIDFTTELSVVRFREHVSPVGLGTAAAHVTGDAMSKLWADSEARFVALIRITDSQKQQAEYTLIPFANIAFCRVKAQPPIVRAPAKRVAEAPA